MYASKDIALVETIRDLCRVCYTCVRECPAKAIRIADGQAEVIPERCIGCGNCVCVCSQRAKRVARSIETVEALLAGDTPVAACIAPSFPAEFAECDADRFVGMVRALGFKTVTEVGFGADLVADRYRRLVKSGDGRRYIATTCPAVVAYVERYHPDLVDSLAPVVSPMIAQARALRELYGEDVRIVFIGPCIAKKGEIHGPEVAGDVNAVLTFAELREMLGMRNLLPASVEPSEFDPPHPGPGALFPIGGGMLQAADIPEDLLTGEVVAADGRTGFVEAIKEFEAGDLNVGLLEVLACSGCIMGPGMGGHSPLFGRRAKVSQYVRARMATLDRQRWREDMKRFANLNLTRSFQPDDQRFPAPSAEELAAILGRMGKFCPEDELNCGACGYDTCREHAMAIHRGLADNATCLPYSIERLRASRDELARTQEALVQSEKLASMGQLAAGIAHELNNPLGVVLMYAHLLQEEHGGIPELKEDLELLATQADRCKRIVAGLLHFARQDRVELRPTDLHEEIELALKAAPVPENVELRIERALEDPAAELDADQVMQVLVNLLTNAYAAMPEGGTLTLSTSGNARTVCVRVADTGVGIAKENISKIFEPFFTTKAIGKGTGLGLAVAYGIVKMHRGDIRVASNADTAAGPTGSTFTVTLPRHREPEGD